MPNDPINKQEAELLASTPAKIDPEVFRRCGTCGKEKPLTAFAWNNDDKVFRVTKCLVCAGGYDNAALQREKKKRQEALSLMVAGMRGDKIDVPHISQLGESMFALFGGVEGVAMEWKRHIDIAAMERPGTKLVLDQFKALTQLLKWSTELRGSAPDLAGVTDEEMAAEIQGLIDGVVPMRIERLEDERNDEPQSNAG